MKIETKTLKNGLRIILEKLPVEKIAFSITFQAGSDKNDEKTQGLAHILEHNLVKSSKKRNKYQVVEEFDFLGSFKNASTSKNLCRYYFIGLKENFEASLEIMSDIIFNMDVSEEDFLKEKAVIKDELIGRKDANYVLLYEELVKIYCAGTNEQYSIIGTEKSIDNTTYSDIKEFFNKYYTSNNCVISVVGNIEMEELEKLIKKYVLFDYNAELPVLTFSSRKIKPTIKEHFVFIDKPTEQAKMVILIPNCIDKSDNEFYVSYVYLYLMGRGSSSRLTKEIRENLGLVYDITMFIYPLPHLGYYTIEVGCAKEKILDVLNGIKRELVKMANDLVPEYDLQKVKNRYKFLKACKYDDILDISTDYARDLIFDNKILYDEEEVEKFNKITAQQVKNYANKILTEKNWLVGILGKEINKEEIQKFKLFE